jgi:prepilin-type N-terminal cleavage/methylation domain-containing protein
MVLSQTSVRRGFTLIEMLTVLVVSSMMLVVMASLFRTGFWEVSRSSGRIEMVRRGRHALNNVQRYLSTTIAASGLALPNGNPITSAIYTPLDTEIYDSDLPDSLNPAPTDNVRFYTPIDLLSDVPTKGARELQSNPVNFAYEITAVPGLDDVGQDLVLRRLETPSSVDPYPLMPDTSIQARYLGRRLGVPDPSAPGGYRDGMIIRRLREGALQIQVNVSSDLISDELNRNNLENATPLRITMSTIFQPPYYNIH